MSNKPKIYGYCKAGCAWRVPHYSDLETASTYLVQSVEDGSAEIEPLKKYKINAVPRAMSATSLLTLPDPVEEAAVVVVGAKVYVFGGRSLSTNASISKIQIYDTLTNTATTSETACANNVCWSAAAVGNNIYLFGGCIDTGSHVGSGVSTIYKFDTVTETFTELSATLNVGLTDMSVVSIGNQIYVLGGMNASNDTSTIVYKFDTATETITAVTTGVGFSYGAVAAVGNKIYLFGGKTADTTNSTVVRVFDTETNTAIALDTSYSGYFNINAVPVGNKIYLFGGRTSVNSAYGTTTIQVFDTETKTINTVTQTLPTAIYGGGAVAVGANVYLVGNIKGKGEIQHFNPDTYDCSVIIKTDSCDYVIGIDAFDLYRKYFYLEVLHAQANEAGTALSLVYEINGKRMFLEIGDTAGLLANALYTVENVQNVFLFNEDAFIRAENGEDGNSVFIRYSANADGTDFTETWQTGQNYIGFATAKEAPTDKAAYTWCLFSCGDVNAKLDVLLAEQEKYINS